MIWQTVCKMNKKNGDCAQFLIDQTKRNLQLHFGMQHLQLVSFMILKNGINNCIFTRTTIYINETLIENRKPF